MGDPDAEFLLKTRIIQFPHSHHPELWRAIIDPTTIGHAFPFPITGKDQLTHIGTDESSTRTLYDNLSILSIIMTFGLV